MPAISTEETSRVKISEDELRDAYVRNKALELVSRLENELENYLELKFGGNIIPPLEETPNNILMNDISETLKKFAKSFKDNYENNRIKENSYLFVVNISELYIELKSFDFTPEILNIEASLSLFPHNYNICKKNLKFKIKRNK